MRLRDLLLSGAPVDRDVAACLTCAGIAVHRRILIGPEQLDSAVHLRTTQALLFVLVVLASSGGNEACEARCRVQEEERRFDGREPADESDNKRSRRHRRGSAVGANGLIIAFVVRAEKRVADPRRDDAQQPAARGDGHRGQRRGVPSNNGLSATDEPRCQRPRGGHMRAAHRECTTNASARTPRRAGAPKIKG